MPRGRRHEPSKNQVTSHDSENDYSYKHIF